MTETTSKTAPSVGVVMGSESDWATMQRCAQQLDALEVTFEVRVLSAHRAPDDAQEYAAAAQQRGLKVIIAAAGLAAHLAGAMAARSRLPIIGVPMAAGPLNGIDALLATVHMPPGVPVATVGIGKAGAMNAAILAAQIIATADAALGERIATFRAAQSQKVRAANAKLSDPNA